MEIKKRLTNIYNALLYPFLTILSAVYLAFADLQMAYGQDEGDLDVDVAIGEEGGAWYTNWWIWVVVLLVFIIIIVAITNRGKRTD